MNKPCFQGMLCVATAVHYFFRINDSIILEDFIGYNYVYKSRLTNMGNFNQGVDMAW